MTRGPVLADKGQAQSPRKIATTPKPSLTVFSTRGRYWSATGWPPKQDVRQKYEYEYNNENSFGKSSKDSRGKDIRRKTEGTFNHASMKCLSSRFSLVLIIIHTIFKKLCQNRLLLLLVDPHITSKFISCEKIKQFQLQVKFNIRST